MTSRHVAAIDVGTNSFHLLIAEITGERFKIVYRARKVLRLRDFSNSESFIIQDNKIIEAIELLKEYSRSCSLHNAEIYAVATSAIREAVNKDDVCNRIYDGTGIRIKVLSGDEEAILSFKGAIYDKDVSQKRVLVFDLGGGSTEFIIGQEGKIIYKSSVLLGAVRLTQLHFPDFYLTSDRIANLRNNVRAVLKHVQNEILTIGFDYCIGIGGTVTSLSWLIEKNVYGRGINYKNLPDYRITINDFEQVKEIVLQNKSFEERKSIHGLELKRADIIPAGILILSELITTFQINEIISSGNSIKEGIILNANQPG